MVSIGGENLPFFVVFVFLLLDIGFGRNVTEKDMRSFPIVQVCCFVNIWHCFHFSIGLNDSCTRVQLIDNTTYVHVFLFDNVHHFIEFLFFKRRKRRPHVRNTFKKKYSVYLLR